MNMRVAAAGLAVLLLAAPAVADEKSLFHIPGAEDFRVQHIARQDRETNWPFTVDQGLLLCAFGTGMRMVFFATQPGFGDDIEGFEPRLVAVSTDPLDLIFFNMANRDLIKTYGSIEEMIEAIGPWFRLGKRLCDQTPGEILPLGDL